MRSKTTQSNPLRQKREALGLTREQLAVKIGVCSSTLYLAERGLMSANTAAKLAEALGVRAEELAP